MEFVWFLASDIDGLEKVNERVWMINLQLRTTGESQTYKRLLSTKVQKKLRIRLQN